MGIDFEAARFLISCSPMTDKNMEKVDFSKTLTLGRQVLLHPTNDFKHLFKRYFNNEFYESECSRFFDTINKNSLLSDKNGNVIISYSEPFFILLTPPPPENGSGSHAVESIDISDFENASIIHDLSMPILDDLKNRFSCVYDGGMLEHVYNYPVALKNAMDMLANGGHLILSTPGNNYFGHGFYQFSAELFYSVLREENGFTNTRVYLNNGRKWYAVKNPRELHARVELSPRWLNARLHVISKKVGEVPINVFSYQSDYEQAWESGIISYNIPQIERIAARLFPILLRKQLGIFYYSLKYRKMFNSYFNKINM